MGGEPWKLSKTSQTTLLTWWKMLVAAHNVWLEPHCENIKPGVSVEWKSPVNQKDKPGQKWGEEYSWQFQKSPAGRECLRLSMNQNHQEDLWKHQLLDPIPRVSKSVNLERGWRIWVFSKSQVMLGFRDSSLGACGLDIPLTCFVLCVLGRHWYVGQWWIRMLMPSTVYYSHNPSSNPIN